MGLFSKLRADINHGGITLQLKAPGSVAADQPILVTVNVSSKRSQTINCITLKLEAQARETGISMSGKGIGINEEQAGYQTVAQVESREPFAITPGETKTISLTLYVGGTTNALLNPLAQRNDLGVMGSAVQTLAATMASGLGHIDYLYRLHASADVQGVGIGPSKNLSIQIAPAAATPLTSQTHESLSAQNQPTPMQQPSNPLTTGPNQDPPTIP